MTVPRSGIMIQLHILKDITDKENYKMKSRMDLKKLCKQAETDSRIEILYDTNESFTSLIDHIFIKVRSYNCTIYKQNQVIYYQPNFPRLNELKSIYPNYKLMEDNR